MPRDLIILLAVLFVTYSLQFLGAASLLAYLRLTPLAWRLGFAWQLGTYAFIGYGPPSFWFLLELLILFFFGRDVYRRAGRKGFWGLILWGVVGAAVVAALVNVLQWLVTGSVSAYAFGIMQGQRILLAVLVAAFATMNRYATIYLFFILPVQARWFLPIEILLAFIGFLGTGDLAGFLGITAAVGIIYSLITPGGMRRLRREGWLRLQQLWIKLRLGAKRRRRGFRVIPGEGGEGRRGGDGGSQGGPWVH